MLTSVFFDAPSVICAAMNEFIDTFRQSAPARLTEIRAKIAALRFANVNATEHMTILREIFRQIHTLKGTAAAFGHETIRQTAHEFENILEKLRSGEIVFDEKVLETLKSGVAEIAAALENTENFKTISLKRNFTAKTLPAFEEILPPEFAEKLKNAEKRLLRQARANGATIFVLAVEFALDEFQTKLKELRAALENQGEIVALLPGNFCANQKINLQIIFAGSAANLAAVISDSSEIRAIWQSKTSFAEIAQTAILAGQRAAAETNKTVDFWVRGKTIKFADDEKDALCAALPHLTINAVVHGIETPAARAAFGKPLAGKINLSVRQNADFVLIEITDDGRGIDFEKLRRRAAELNLTLQDPADLIFQNGFSTAAVKNKLAGRGVGLDAAKTAVEKIGGTIKIISKLGKQTRFQIKIPRRKSKFH
jgi:two-component system chemotaxis sensor kinase CheA